MKTISTNPRQEVQRYLSNAREILTQKANKKDGLYTDIKYVKMAAGTAYSGALLVLDTYLETKEGLKYKKPRSIEEYRTRLAKYNKKLLAVLEEVYADLHLAGYYHGTPSVNIIQNGLKNVAAMVEYI